MLSLLFRPTLVICFSALVLISNWSCVESASRTDSCKTPNGEDGKCISIYECKTLYGILTTKNETQKKFLKDSQCGYTVSPLVCCGTETNFRSNFYDSHEDDENYEYGGQNSFQQSFNREKINNRISVDSSSCGFQLANRILDGTVTALDEFPWMALLQYRSRSNGNLRFACGGSLINSRYILTAAHCVTGEILVKVGNLENVRLGDHNTSSPTDCIGGNQYCNSPVDIKVERVIPHPNYDDNDVNKLNDIALVKLNQDVTFTDFIRPICLPDASDISNIGETLTVAGWGRTERAKSSPVKLKLAVPLADNSKCSSQFRSAGINLARTQICAGGQKGRDSCTGDSGGPLMRTKKNTSQWYVEGIVSFGTTCGTENWPGVYTQVSSYRDWINRELV